MLTSPPTSYSGEREISPSSMRAALAVVPPMSRVIASRTPMRRAR